MERVAFRVDSGVGVGMGHLTRMSALSAAFRIFGAECAFFQSCDEPVDYRGFDIIVMDSYMLSSEYIDALREYPALTVCYDDNALYEYSCDILVNANLHADTLDFRFGRKKPKLLLGGRYALLREEFWDAGPICIKEKAERVLLIFGGTDVNRQTQKMLEVLLEIEGIGITAVFGAEAEGFEQCLKVAEANRNAHVVQAPQSIMEAMRECDMAVTAGGTTVYELAALGIPSLVVPQAENQLLAAKYLTENGFMKSLGWWEGVTPGLLREETLELLYNESRRKTESERLRNAVGRRGAMALAEAILRGFRLRQAGNCTYGDGNAQG